ncbi:ANISERP protein, partial [Aphelenchoides avenae]
HAEYTLEAANRVYAQAGFTVRDTFRADIERYYRGLFKQVDFKEGAKAAKDINAFVEEKTHDKIKNAISPDVINESTRLLLINAIYFKGTWKNKFNKALTEKKKTFYVSESKEAKVDMMHLGRTLIYFEDDDAQVLGLPYEGDDLFLFVILPCKRYGLQDLLRSLDGKKLTQYLGKSDKRLVNVQLPRFTVETSLALKGALSSLGLSDAFDPEKANFKGIAKEPLFIQAVLHKAFVE